VAVIALTFVAEELGLPEYVVSFLGLALGTSLPELMVAITAVRQGQTQLALGDAFGATLADASLSVGTGPIVAPTLVTADLVVRGGLISALAVALAAGLLVVAGRHNRFTGLLLLAVYAGSAWLIAVGP
jgi:cation:H+ antiporter